MKKKTFFIAFEGIDGSGKSTQIKKLYNKLIRKKISVHLTYEPTDGYIGKIIREIFLNQKQADEHTITALFLADRLEHILNPNNGILKYLNSKISVLCDRYYFSSYAYHSIHVEKDWVLNCNSKCKKFLQPDLTVFFDISVEESIKRIKKRNCNQEIYETEENLKKVRNNYLNFLKKFKYQEQIFYINASLNEEEVFLNLWNKINSIFILE